MKGIWIFLAEGFEETEALATWDVLHRGGLDAKLVSITESSFVKGSHGLEVKADLVRSEFKEIICFEGTQSEDVMVFPGGMPGTRNLASNQELMDLMKLHYAEGGTVAAICAAPGLVVSQIPDLTGKRFTCFDGFEDAPMAKGAEYVQSPAVADGNLVTGRGAGCAIEFGLAILAGIKGKEASDNVRKGMML